MNGCVQQRTAWTNTHAFHNVNAYHGAIPLQDRIPRHPLFGRNARLAHDNRLLCCAHLPENDENELMRYLECWQWDLPHHMCVGAVYEATGAIKGPELCHGLCRADIDSRQHCTQHSDDQFRRVLQSHRQWFRFMSEIE